MTVDVNVLRVKAAPLLTALMLTLTACDRAAEPPQLDPPAARHARAVRVVGVSAATPLVTRLVRSFAARIAGLPLVVEAPLSQVGAEAALADGVVDAAVVLRSASDPPPPNGVRLARTMPLLVVGPGVPIRRVGAADLARRLTDPQPRWPDGHPLRLILRPLDDPLQRAVAAMHPDLEAAIAEAVKARRFRVVPHDAELREALRATPGAIAVTDLGSLRMHATPLWRVRLNEGRPKPVDVWLLTGETPAPRLRAFFDFATSADGRSLVGDLGYGVPR